MGVTTGGTHAPVLDSEKRPITAGGFVKTGPVVFQDIAAKAGLTVWQHTMGTPQKQYILEATGSGVALLDYDNDGWLDIYMVNGSTYDALSGKAAAPRRSLPQQPRRHLYRCRRKSRSDQRPLGIRRSRRRLRQRWLARSIRRQLRQESPLSQQPRWHLHRHRGEGRSATGRLVERPDLWRLRRRWPARSVRLRLRALRPGPAADPMGTRWPRTSASSAGSM